MTVTKDGDGLTNVWAKEPEMYVDPNHNMKEVLETYWEKAERLNGRLAMLGVIAALGAYAITGQIIPGQW